MEKKGRAAALNILFIAGAAALLFLLTHAPKETTAHLPKDEIHLKFYGIARKKEAERFCNECHGDGGSAPLSPSHPPPYRCLFCHKR
ncbi:MAG: hypothetical protein LBH14_01745 [Desulfobulbaceae bacterium]|jgi:hypothetical protein|nr:hypothetical protein [Desulfobulbaceae bacterium]